MKKTIIAMLLLLTMSPAIAQLDFNYWDRKGCFSLYGGGVIPGMSMKSTLSNGLYAKNGFQFGFNYNYIFAYGLGIGFNFEYDQFAFNKNAFLISTDANSMSVSGGYSSPKIGLNFITNIPAVIDDDRFTLNFFGIFNPGLMMLQIPEIDLFYDENLNKYTEVHYRPRSNTMGYLSYSGGMMFIFSNNIGLSISRNVVLKSRHSINYSSRMFDAFGQLYESEDYLNNYLDHKGWQIGVIFRSKKR
jgi:hypothetical protein